MPPTRAITIPDLSIELSLVSTLVDEALIKGEESDLSKVIERDIETCCAV